MLMFHFYAHTMGCFFSWSCSYFLRVLQITHIVFHGHSMPVPSHISRAPCFPQEFILSDGEIKLWLGWRLYKALMAMPWTGLLWDRAAVARPSSLVSLQKLGLPLVLLPSLGSLCLAQTHMGWFSYEPQANPAAPHHSWSSALTDFKVNF